MRKIVYITGILSLCISCGFFKKETYSEAVAKVNKSFLYKKEIQNLIPDGTSKGDSMTIVRNYIDRWAKQSLLIDAAKVNLSHKKKVEFDKLIQQYKTDLYTKAYIEEIVQRSVDTVITKKELIDYYKENKDNFKINGDLVRLRYVSLSKDNPNIEVVKTKFLNYEKNDNKFWDTHSIQLNSFSLDDSIWVSMDQIYEKLPFITPENKNDYIQNNRTVHYSDYLNTYLIKVNDVLNENEISPFEYVEPVLKQIILNKRQLELIKKFEKDIIDDAIKDNVYEVYGR